MRWRRVRRGKGGKVASCGEVKETGRRDRRNEEGSGANGGATIER